MSCHSDDAGGTPGEHFTLYKDPSTGGGGKTPEQCRTECYHDDACLAFETGPSNRCEIWTDANGNGVAGVGIVRVGHTTSANFACYIKLTHIAGSGFDTLDYPDCND